MGGGLLSPFIFVIFLWISQKRFSKVRTLYLCSLVPLIVIFVTKIVNSLNNFFFQNELLSEVVGKVFIAGTMLAKPFHKTFEPTILFIVLVMLFSEIFYTIILFPIVLIMSYIKEKYLSHKTDEMGEINEID
jgi:hypothetical protein